MHRRQRPDSPAEGGGTLHPTELGDGTQVGDWRVLWRHELGTFGAVYLVVRVGQEAAGPCALKLARGRGDARLAREVDLLGRVQHPNVPRLRGHGQWYGFPFVVMEWVEGPVLYRWARLCNPSLRQVIGLLAKVAGALAAVHAVGGAHRDMKGDNVLVRMKDGEPMLTDFGAGTWEGAAPLTVNGPPGTPLYYSPERLRSHLNLLPPGSPSGAGPADDVYGLGVTAYRLLTDCYPFLELEEGQRTQERLGGRLPRAPRELNPGVPEELSALVLRMMASRPEERPPSSEVAGVLEAMAQIPEGTEEKLLFTWETEPSRLGPGQRLHSRVEYERWLAQARIEEGQARVAAEFARVQSRKKAESQPPRTAQPDPIRERRQAVPWRWVALAAWVLGVLGAGVLGWMLRFDGKPSALPALPRKVAHVEAPETGGAPDAGTVGMGDDALASASAASPGVVPRQPGVRLQLPKEPLDGQKRPPCHPRWEAQINGGCWISYTTMKPPCGSREYEWKEGCYLPVWVADRPPTSDQPGTP
jgi:serine/threonine protein kinase